MKKELDASFVAKLLPLYHPEYREFLEAREKARTEQAAAQQGGPYVIVRPEFLNPPPSGVPLPLKDSNDEEE